MSIDCVDRNGASPAPLIHSIPVTMSLDNSTLPYFREIELNTLALNFLEGILSTATTGDIMVQISLASLSFGEQSYPLLSNSPS